MKIPAEKCPPVIPGRIHPCWKQACVKCRDFIDREWKRKQ